MWWGQLIQNWFELFVILWFSLGLFVAFPLDLEVFLLRLCGNMERTKGKPLTIVIVW
jgi:hypothetical protein